MYVYVCVWICVLIYIHTYTHICTYICIICIYIWGRQNTDAVGADQDQIFLFLCSFFYVIDANQYLYQPTHTHTHTHTHTLIQINISINQHTIIDFYSLFGDYFFFFGTISFFGREHRDADDADQNHVTGPLYKTCWFSSIRRVGLVLQDFSYQHSKHCPVRLTRNTAL